MASRANHAENLSRSLAMFVCRLYKVLCLFSFTNYTHIYFCTNFCLAFFPPSLSFVCALEMLFEKNMIRKQIVPLERENYSRHSRTLDLTGTCTQTLAPLFELLPSTTPHTPSLVSSYCTLSFFYILIHTLKVFYVCI